MAATSRDVDREDARLAAAMTGYRNDTILRRIRCASGRAIRHRMIESARRARALGLSSAGATMPETTRRLARAAAHHAFNLLDVLPLLTRPRRVSAPARQEELFNG
jgi:hypothetical protein